MSDYPTYQAFSPGSKATWQQHAEQESKGNQLPDAFDLEGLSLRLFYTAEDAPPSLGLPAPARPWQYRASVAADATQAALRHTLSLGADGVIVSEPSPEQWQLLLHDLKKAEAEPITQLSLACITPAPYLDPYQSYQQALADRGHTLTGTLYCHPLERWYQQQVDYRSIMESLATYLKQTNEPSAIRALALNGGVFLESGMNVVDELGCVLSLLVAYYDQLTDQGVSAPTLWNHTEVTLATGSDYYVDLAKFRAIRLLLAQVAEAYQIQDAAEIPIRAVSGWRNKTLYDANSNLLRNTTEAMAALLGGANVITLLPHNALHPTAPDFGERMAINVVNILKHEAHLEKVSDPAAGSYFLESLTRQLVEKAWAKFLEIEEEGGWVKAVASGKIQSAATAARKSRADQVRRQQTVLIGANKYARADESLTFTLPESLPPRLAWEVEQVRYRVDQHVAQGKPRPHWRIYTQPGTPSAIAKGKFITQLLPLGGITYERQTWMGKETSPPTTPGAIFCGDDAFYQKILDTPLPTGLRWMIGAPPDGLSEVSEFLDPQQDVVTLLHQLLQPWYDEA